MGNYVERDPGDRGGKRRGVNSSREDCLGERDYFKEIAPENVTSSRRLMVKSVFSVGKQLDSGGRESVENKL